MSSAEGGRRAGYGLAALSGVLLVLAFPHADLGVLAFVALVPLFLAARRAAPGQAARYGLAFGAVFFTGLLYWIAGVMTRYGHLPVPVAASILLLLVGYLAAYSALFAALLAAATRRFGGLGLAAAPCVWVALELGRERLLTGFPWGTIGYSQWRNLPLLQLSALGGVPLVSLVVVAVNAAIAALLARDSGRTARRVALLTLAACGAAHLAGWGMLRQVSAPDRRGGGDTPLPVAAIQANVPQGVKMRGGEEAAIVEDLLAMSRRAGQEGARLVVWPESSSPWSFYHPVPVPSEPDGMVIEPRRPYTDRVIALAKEGGFTIIAGSVDFRGTGGELRAYNSAFVVSPDGRIGPVYDKVHLVPFGEYVPLQKVLFFVDKMAGDSIGEFRTGERTRPLATAVGDAGTFVCYEAVFPDLVRRIARGSTFLVNITNDAWFGRSPAARQHLAMAATRAAENRRWLLRAANTGISALVDPAGRVVRETPLFEKTVLSGAIVLRDDRTLYSRVGDVVPWGCAIVSALLVAALRAAFLRRGP